MLSLPLVWLSLMLLTLSPSGPEPLEQDLRTFAAHLISPDGGGELRFEIELEPRADGVQGFVRNGVERRSVPRTEWDGRRLVLHFTEFDATLVLEREGDAGELRGEWRQRRGVDYWAELPAVAVEGRRESRHGEAITTPIDGRWRVKFESETDDAIGVFASHEGQLLGTFLTTKGDYRWLHGEQVGSGMRISAFDGSHAFLFTAELQDDGTLKGDFWSQNRWHETFTAVRDHEAVLLDGFGLTRFEADADIDELAFPDLDGELKRLGDPAFAGKARLIQLFGSWCPNCHDASEFFVELHEEYAERGLSILGLAFEYTGDHERDALQVRRYAETHDVKWPLLVAGLSTKSAGSKALPFLDKVRSYPTTIFVRGDGSVRAVYQGFSGPATGEAYVELKARFRELVEELLDESAARG